MSRKVAETLVVNLAIQGTAALTGVLLARLLGAGGRGDLATALVWPSILGGIAVFGTDVAFARLAASNGHRLRQIYHALTSTVALVSVAAMIIGFLVLPRLFPAGKLALVDVSYLLLLSIPASVASVLCANVALGLGEHRLFNGIRLSFSVAYVVSVLAVAAITHSSVLSTAVCFLAAAFVAAVYGLAAMRARMRTKAGPRVEMAAVFVAAAPFGFSSAVQSLVANLPVALLTFLAESNYVGYFVVAMVASGIHSSVGSAIGKMLFAKVCASDEDVNTWFGPVFRQSLVLYVLLAAVLAALLPLLVPLVFGDAFSYSGVLAIGLVVSTSIAALASLLEETLRAKGRARPVLNAQLAGAGVLLLVAIPLVPDVGLKGMVWACILGALVQLFVLCQSLATELQVRKRELVCVSKSDVRALFERLRVALIAPEIRGDSS